MDTFLAQVAAHISGTFGTDTAGLCVVVPNRRAGLFLQQALAARYNQPIFAPVILGLKDFIAQSSEQHQPDRLTLLFALFEAYRTQFENENFEQFYPWGEMLLADFDELDKHLVNARQLFVNLQQAKNLEQSLDFSVTELESYRQFWSSFSNRPLSDHQNRFLALWEKLPRIYEDFHNLLKQNGWSYEGNMARQLVERLRHNPTLPPQWPYMHIILAGLHAPAKAEQNIIDVLVQQGHATVLPDADAYYVTNVPQHEAGGYFRTKGVASLTQPQRYFGAHPQAVHLVGASMRVGQAHAAGAIVAQLLQQGSALDRTAVVLPDESLLLPVLYSLPPAVEKLNVTMGYPLAGSPVHTLLLRLFGLWRNARRDADGNTVAYYHRDVWALVHHGYVQSLWQPHTENALAELAKQQQAYIPAQALAAALGGAQADILHAKDLDAAKALQHAIGLLQGLLTSWQDGTEASVIERQSLGYVLSQLLRMQDTLLGYLPNLSVEGLARLLTQTVAGMRVPFSGEPLEGLQIMGFLETRALDFDNVIILGLNEGVLPPHRHAHSFVPYNLRKSYGLPTLEDDDGTNAYHFYRLLQRAQNIYLVYDASSAREDNSGEPSRYLLQLELELQPRFAGSITLSKSMLMAPAQTHTPADIVVHKEEWILNKLDEYVGTIDRAPVKSFSPSALQLYRTCPLQFYYRYIAGLREPTETEEELEDNVFGTVFHETIRSLYEPWVGKILQAEDVGSVRAGVYNALLRAARATLPDLHYAISGRNLLRLRILERLLHNVLDEDARHAPFLVEAIEQQLARDLPLGDGRHVRIAGQTDRIDRKGNAVRVVDYKTGNVDQTSAKPLPEILADARYKEPFQAAVYAWLYPLPPGAAIQVAIVPLKTIVKGLYYPLQEEDQYLLRDVADESLRQLTREILNPAESFVQIKHEKTCGYCPYYRLCYLS